MKQNTRKIICKDCKTFIISFLLPVQNKNELCKLLKHIRRSFTDKEQKYLL